MMRLGYYWATCVKSGAREVVLVYPDCMDEVRLFRHGRGAMSGLKDFTDYDGPLTDPRTPATAGDTRKDG
jgi:hypothetical protein